MSDFVAVLEAKRAAFQASVETITKQKKPLNASASDALAQLKSTAFDLAHHTADHIQAELTQIAQNMQNSHDADQFRSDANQLREKVPQDVGDDMDTLFDKAKKLVQNEDSETAEAILDWMPTAQSLSRNMLSKIKDFITNAINNVLEWIPDALASIKTFFSNLSAFIDAAL
jgi:phage-related protein